jgi:Tat protein translocase TatB subunit
MFGTLGGPELFLIFVVALIVFGPRKLPDIGKSLGRMMGEFRRASNEFRSTIESEVESEKIKESMRIEPPKVEPVKAKPPADAATAAGVAATDGGDTSPEADDASDETTPSDADPHGSTEPPSGSGPASSSDTTSGGSEPSSDAASGTDAPAEPVPSTVSRQPPAPAEEPK